MTLVRVRQVAVVKNPIVRFFLILLGIVSLVVGIIGVFLPVLPTTPFILLSTACFFRSSKKLYNFLYNSKALGPSIRDWEERGVISRKSKTIALLSLLVSFLIIFCFIKKTFVVISVGFIMLLVSIFISTRPGG